MAMSTRILALALTYLGGVDAFFRINCATINRGRIDPLVNPGTLAAHSHTIVGSANIGVNATFQTLSTAACTSCETSADKSAYWSPTLYYKYPNGSFLEVPHGGGVVYYLGRGPNVNKTVPFPPGMMILTGDKSARSYDNTTMTYGTAQYPGRPIADRVSFACLTATDGVQQTVGINNTDCLNGLRAQVHYQSCWNGNDLYKADNSHVAYQSAIDDGICPPTHPVQLPHVFLEVLYNVNDVPNKTADGLFVFSQGDPTGYGFHADFQNGWDMKVQTNITIDCLATDNFGQISACPALQATQSDGYANNCPERPPQIGEATNGLISQLPGCITITYGPGAAPAASMSCPSTVPKPSITKTQDTVVPPTKLVAPGRLFGGLGHQYLGCYNDSAGGVRALNAYAYTNTTGMTVEMCQSICTSKGYGLHGVEYAQECHCDNKLNNNAVRGPLGCNWNCAGTMSQGLAATQEICGGYGYISVYNQTNFTVPAPVAKVGGYAYQGCLTDPNNGGGRSLLGPATTSAQMTNEMCVQFCQGKGQRYAGMEYASECYCDNRINSRSGAKLNKDCTGVSLMACAGNTQELCGGPSVMTLFYSTLSPGRTGKRAIGELEEEEGMLEVSES